MKINEMIKSNIRRTASGYALRELIHAQWVAQIPIVNQYAEDSFGIKMLKEFWERLGLKEAA